MDFGEIRDAWKTIVKVFAACVSALFVITLLFDVASGDPSKVIQAGIDESLGDLLTAAKVAAIPVIGTPLTLFFLYRWWRYNH